MSFKVNSACWDNLYNTIGYKMYLMHKAQPLKVSGQFLQIITYEWDM